MNDRSLDSLHYLLVVKKVSIGTLASAIEAHGVHGWDRYRRFKRFEPDTEDARRALDALAAECAHEPSLDSMSPLDWANAEPRSDFNLYGWLDTELPDFDEIQSGTLKVSTPQRPQSVAKKQNADLAVIGRLLLFIEGGLTSRKHPDFKSQSDLIQTLRVDKDDLPGLSARSLETKFATAKAFLNEKKG